jgi:uncharacterized protein (TIGR02145 family)
MNNNFSILIFFILITCSLYAQNIGIGTNNPQSKLHLNDGDVYLQQIGSGVIIKSPNGTCWRLQVTDDGLSNFTLMTCPEDILSYGGQNYKTKIMPDGKRWMVDNLNVGAMINGNNNMTNNNTIEKFCYDNNLLNCAIYGGLYQWDEMMQYNSSEGSQGVCPQGWHLPTIAEWTSLEAALPSPDKGSRLSGNASLWINGTRENSIFFGTTGFSAIPSGSRGPVGGFFDKDTTGSYWSSSQYNATGARFLIMGFSSADNLSIVNDKGMALSVRCVQN